MECGAHGDRLIDGPIKPGNRRIASSSGARQQAAGAKWAASSIDGSSYVSVIRGAVEGGNPYKYHVSRARKTC